VLEETAVELLRGAMPQPTLWARLEPHLKPPKAKPAATG